MQKITAPFVGGPYSAEHAELFSMFGRTGAPTKGADLGVFSLNTPKSAAETVEYYCGIKPYPNLNPNTVPHLYPSCQQPSP